MLSQPCPSFFSYKDKFVEPWQRLIQRAWVSSSPTSLTLEPCYPQLKILHRDELNYFIFKNFEIRYTITWLIWHQFSFTVSLTPAHSCTNSLKYRFISLRTSHIPQITGVRSSTKDLCRTSKIFQDVAHQINLGKDFIKVVVNMVSGPKSAIAQWKVMQNFAKMGEI